MRHILVIAEPELKTGPALQRALALAAESKARVSVIGFVHDPLVQVAELDNEQLDAVYNRTKLEAMKILRKMVKDAGTRKGVKVQVDAVWEKRLADWVVAHAAEMEVDLVVKTGHRSESWIYTPTDWQLMRSCPVPLLIVPTKPWHKRAECVLAAVDLGDRSTAGRALNVKIVETAAQMAKLEGLPLHLAYVTPTNKALQDLGVIDVRKTLGAARQEAQAFIAARSADGIDIAALYVKAGSPTKVLASIAAQHHARCVTLGSVGRKALAGKMTGNTAEKLLHFLKADALTVRP